MNINKDYCYCFDCGRIQNRAMRFGCEECKGNDLRDIPKLKMREGKR